MMGLTQILGVHGMEGLRRVRRLDESCLAAGAACRQGRRGAAKGRGVLVRPPTEENRHRVLQSIAVFVNNHYNSSIISFGQGPSLEYIWLKVHLLKQKIAIGIFYRPPHSSVTEAGNTFDNMLPAILAEYDDIILEGDINVNLLLVCNNLTKCLDSYNLEQES
ncbi:unnamed protein product [Acanthoscelides obtectus]|uniref:Uncharacterized protein n=1 Tax=Acanthoscelides obtectus TaxID=200917 RepID=A0A9P0KPZ0_ACAOB|nr:unnamed protein product [Acanthoscelides obtectus]CAK1664409.1 hypothetical protein AOBTE_LOCUS24246 [Acanthoscelides obtectus]